jgi:hypothetical protein
MGKDRFTHVVHGGVYGQVSGAASALGVQVLKCQVQKPEQGGTQDKED